MTIPVTNLNILYIMLQCQQNLTGLQRDMRQNAQAWLAVAQAQSMTVTDLANTMNIKATAYQTRLGWLTTLEADPNWPTIGTMWGKLGGTAQDFSDMITPLTAVANQLGPADKSTYAAIISVCNQIIAAIPMPLSLWPE